MRFLHLSDLHIGKGVNGFSMLEEQRHVFEQIIGYIQTEKPTAVLIAGDVYDRAVPSVEAVRLFDDFLTELSHAEAAVLLISGNHDSPERLNYASRLLSEKRIHLCGVFNGELQSVTLSDEYGDVRFWLLPFIKPSTVRGVLNARDMLGDIEIDSYSDAISSVLASANIDYSARNVLLSHQFYTAVGVTPVRSESEINPVVGGLDAVDARLLSGFDYVALGHLHGAQGTGGNVRYAGSPVKYSFSECKQEKSVTLVDFCDKKSGIKVKTLPLIPLHDMREIKGPIEQLLSDEIASQGEKDDYLRVTLTDEDEIIDAVGKIRSVYPNVMALAIENSHTDAEIMHTDLDVEQIGKLSPYDLFSEFFLESKGAVMSEEQAKIVRELLEDSDQ